MKKNKFDYDAIVIGAGAGGLTVAIGLNSLGKKVAIIEKGLMGGECTNTGCVPSKALIHASGTMPPDKAFTYVKKQIINIRREESEKKIESMGIAVFKGTAEFKNNRQLIFTPNRKGAKKTLLAKNIIIAAGARPRMIEIDGLPSHKVRTSDTIWELEKIPTDMVIIGGGPIGVEMGYAFSKLGTKVSIVDKNSRILSSEGKMASDFVEKMLVKEGVHVYKKSSDFKYSNSVFSLKIGKDRVSIKNPEIVLVAIGKEPNVDKLGLDRTDIAFTKQGISVSDSYETSVRGVYALGDIIPHPKFTHLANAQGRFIVSSIKYPFLPQKKISIVPRVTYTSPELASVGKELDEIDKLERGLVKKIMIPLGKTDRGVIDEQDGFVLLYAQTLTGRILRATIVASNAGEMISFFTLMMQKKVSLWTVFKLIIPYPTLSQAFRLAADEFVAGTISNIKVDALSFIKHVLFRILRRHGVSLFAVFFWLVLIASVRVFMSVNNLSFSEMTQNFGDLLTRSSLGPLLYIVVYFLRPLILFPAALLAVLAGFVWGLPEGFFWGLVAGSISAIIPYFMGRFLGRGSGESSTGIMRYARGIKENPFQSVITMRLLFFPYDAVSILAGHRSVSFLAFFLATFIGNIPGSLTFTSFGASIEGELGQGGVSLDIRTLLFSFILLVVSVVGSRYYKKYKEK